MLGSYTLVGDRVLFDLGERPSTSITGSFALLLPPFIADLLNRDIFNGDIMLQQRVTKTTQDNKLY